MLKKLLILFYLILNTSIEENNAEITHDNLPTVIADRITINSIIPKPDRECY